MLISNLRYTYLNKVFIKVDSLPKNLTTVVKNLDDFISITGDIIFYTAVDGIFKDTEGNIVYDINNNTIPLQVVGEIADRELKIKYIFDKG